MEFLNVYGPQGPHDPTFIVGDRESLTELMYAIGHLLYDRSYPDNNETLFDAYDSNGEGYNICVKLFDENCNLGDGELKLPYTSADYNSHQMNMVFPEQLFKRY